jgi:hypothetical protein
VNGRSWGFNVSERGLEHGNRCDFPGSGKSCDKDNTHRVNRPGYPSVCSLFAPMPGWRAWLAACAGAWGQCELAWAGEAEACVAQCVSGEHGGEDAGPLVEVVVDFGRGLVLLDAQDPGCVLGQAALAGARRGEEQGIRGLTFVKLAISSGGWSRRVKIGFGAGCGGLGLLPRTGRGLCGCAGRRTVGAGCP